MGLFRRMFGLPDGQKGVEFDSPAVDQVIAGWPSWPVFDSYGAMYRKQPAVRTVVDFLARNIAQLNPKIYMRIDDNSRLEWGDHPIAELLRNPNPTTTRYAHLRDTVADIAIYDRAYWRKVVRRGRIDALVRVPPSRLQLEFDAERQRTIYRLGGNVITRDELVVFHGYHPDGNEEGVSPLETLRRVLSEEWAAQIHREWYWRNAARTPLALKRPVNAPEWSDEARQRFRADWQASMAGGVNSGKTAILEDGMEPHPLDAFSPRESEYIEGRKLTYEEVARVYGPSLVGLLGAEGQKANVESYHRQLYQDVLAPYCRMLQDEIDAQLLTLPEYDLGPAYTEFNLREKLKGSFVEELDALTKAVGVPHMAINEARARQNLSALTEDWADVPVQPMNIIYGGQPAVNVPIGGGERMAARLVKFYETQEQVLCSRLGDKAPSEVAVLAMWDDDRWNRDHPGDPAENVQIKQKVAAAFASGGLPAVHQVYETLKTDLSLEVSA